MQSNIGKQTRISYEHTHTHTHTPTHTHTQTHTHTHIHIHTQRNKILRNLKTSSLGDIDNF